VAFTFYLGTHMAAWLWDERFIDVPLFISRRRLARRRTRFPRARTDWALDSGGFTELSMHGRWLLSARDYVEQARRYAHELGRMQWAAPQDWMCEPVILAKTGLTVREHQRLTIENYLELRQLAPDLGVVPVLQGWTEHDYYDHVEQYDRAGIDLRAFDLVGVGTMCRRQGTDEAERVLRELERQGLRCHAFGAKVTGLRRYADAIESADSLAWSFRARKIPRLEGCTHNNHCANCPRWALLWREQLLKKIEEGPPMTATAKKTAEPTTLQRLTDETKAEHSPTAEEARNEGSQVLAKLNAFEVTGHNMEQAGDILREVKERHAKLAERLKRITQPMRAAEAEVRNLFRPALSVWAEAEAILKKKIADAQNRQMLLNIEATKQAQVALERGDARGAALVSQVIAPTTAPEGIGIREAWKFTVVDPSLVPRELCSPDDAKIRAAIKINGNQPIPGIVIEPDAIVTVRPR
jgi:hypothetical protein